MRPKALFAHFVDHAARHVEARREVSSAVPRFQRSNDMRCMVPSRVIPALFTSIPIGPRSLTIRSHRVPARLVVRDVELVGADSGAVAEALRRLGIAGVRRGDGVSRVAQRDRDRLADAAGPAGDYCYVSHFGLLSLKSRPDGRRLGSDCRILAGAEIRQASFPAARGPGVSPRPPPLPSCSVSRVPRTSRCPSHRRCTASPGPSSRRGGASRRAVWSAPARRRRPPDARGRSRRRFTLTLPVSHPRSLLTAHACAAKRLVSPRPDRGSPALHPAFSSARAAGRDGAGTHDGRVDPGGGPGDDPGQRLDPALLGVLAGS